MNGERGEAAIKAHGEIAEGRTGDSHRGVEVGLGERERFLDPDVLVGPERRAGETAMFVVAGRDEECLDPGVIKHRGHIGGRRRGRTSQQLRGKPVGGSEDGRRRTLATEFRHQDAGSKIAATDDADAAGGTGIPIRTWQRPGQRLVRDGVFDEQAVGAGTAEVVVDLRCGGKRMARSEQRGDVERTGSHQRENFVEVGASRRRVGRIRRTVGA